MEKRNNKIIIILMALIIVILAVLCVLFATGTILLKEDISVSDNGSSSENNTVNNIEEENVNEGNNLNEISGTYKYSVNITEDQYRIYEITFLNNNEVSYMINVSNSSDNYDGAPVMYYTGTYVLENNKVVLTLKAKTQDGSECIDGKYACNEVMSFNLSDSQLIDFEDSSVIYRKK